MNKCFKVIWNASTQTWQAVSELALSAKKTKSLCLTATTSLVLAASAGVAQAATAIPSTYLNLTGTQTLTIDDVYGHGTDRLIGLKGDSNITIVGNGGDIKIEHVANEGRSPTKPLTWNAYTITTVDANTRSRALTVKDNIYLTHTPHTMDSKGGGRHGVGALWGSSFTFEKDLNVSIKNIKAGPLLSRPEHYGIHAGASVDAPDGLGIDKYGSIHIKGNYTAKMSMEYPSVFNTTTIAGIRSIGGPRYSSSGVLREINSSGKVIIDGKTTIDMSGSGAEGIYVSGGNSEVTLNGDSQITIAASVFGSAALKIGKARELSSYGAGKGLLTSNGNMLLNTEASDGAAIQIQVTDSKFIADSATSSTTIRAKKAALTIGASDWGTHKESNNINVKVRNADWSNTDVASDLIEVSHKQQNALLEVSGDKTNLKGADQAYLIAVDRVGSSLTFNANDAGVMSGMVSREAATFSGDATVPVTSTFNLNLNNGFTWNLKEATIAGATVGTSTFNTLNLSNDAVVNAFKEDGTKANFTLKGDKVLSNGGIINLARLLPAPFDTVVGDVLTIDGDYEGLGNARVKMNTQWDKIGSDSDVLVITGKASGDTLVVPVNSQGDLDVIMGDVVQAARRLQTVPVVKVNQPGSTAFRGLAVTEGGYTVKLEKIMGSSGDEYVWALDPAVVDPRTPGYVLMPQANLEQGYATLRTLHERRGENHIFAWDKIGVEGNAQTWGRIIGSSLDLEGKRHHDMKLKNYGFQFGHDFAVSRTEEGGHRLTGAYVAYSHADIKFDSLNSTRGLIERAGKGKSDVWSVGVSHTRYAPHGGYVDLVGQVSFLRNKYQAQSAFADVLPGSLKAKQSGVGIALSAEVGRPFKLSEHANGNSAWLIEPQAQLIYQTLHLNGFHDGVRKIKQGDQQSLRGRIGARLAYNAPGGEGQSRTKTVYATANIWHDFVSPRAVKVGPDAHRERFANTWLELGLGAQLPLGKQTYLYGDARYERELSGGKRDGYRGTVGLKYTW